METLVINATDETPYVILDKENSSFELSGKSLPEDVSTFYGKVLKWLDAYCESPNSVTEFNFKMDYFNTASSKMILDILLKLEELNEGDSEVKINWYYLEDDEDMEEAGEEYAEMVEIPFNQILVEE